MKKILMVGGAVAIGAGTAMAQTCVADPSTVVSTATTIAASVTTLGLALLGWSVGSRLVRKYIK